MENYTTNDIINILQNERRLEHDINQTEGIHRLIRQISVTDVPITRENSELFQWIYFNILHRGSRQKADEIVAFLEYRL